MNERFGKIVLSETWFRVKTMPIVQVFKRSLWRQRATSDHIFVAKRLSN